MYNISIDMRAARLQHAPHPARVLAKATLRAALALGLSRAALAHILGVSEATLSRVGSEQRPLEPASKEGELAVLLLRLFRSLDSLVGGDQDKARAWLDAPNRHLGGVPRERIQSVQGLVDAIEYLDAMRGKI